MSFLIKDGKILTLDGRPISVESLPENGENNNDSSNCVIEVYAFPYENIQDEVIYKMILFDYEILVHRDGITNTLKDVLNTENIFYEFYLDSSQLEEFLMNSDQYYTYIAVVNNIGYVKYDGILYTIGQYLGLEDKGLIESGDSINGIPGVYTLCVKEFTYGIKGETHNYIDGDWREPNYLANQIIQKTIEKIDLPNIYGAIGSYAFIYSHQLGEVVLENINSIGTNAFKGCENLRRVEFGSAVNEIQDGAFEGCYNLEKIIIKTDWMVPYLGYNAIPDSAYIYVPMSMKEQYTNATNWSDLGEDRFRAIEEYETELWW